MMSRAAFCGILAMMAAGLAGCASQPKVSVADKPELAVVGIESDGASATAAPAACGFLASPDGYLVTTFDAIAGRDACRVDLLDGRKLQADLVEVNHGADLAILKVRLPPPAEGEQKPALPFFRLHDVRIEPKLHTRVAGADAVRHASFDHWENAGRDMALDIPFRPADRGQPVLGDDGSVLGVVRGPAESQGESTAIPIWRVIEMMPKLKG